MSHDYPEAYTLDNLEQIIDSNDHCPSLARDEIERLVELARQRADARGTDSALEDEQTECLIATDWTGFASGEFGYDNGDVNQFAMGVLEERVSAGRDATLFSDTVIVQNGWLQTGDGRRSQVKAYEDEDYERSDTGEMWIPKSAQEYIAIIALDPELIHGEPDASEAM